MRVPHALGAAVGKLEPLILALGMKPLFDRAWLEERIPPLVYSSEKARRELGWAPKYPTTVAVLRRAAEAARGLEDPKIAVFMRLSALAAARQPPRPDQYQGEVHLELTGPGGADYTLHLDGGRLRIARGVPRPPTTVISLRATTFREALAGRQSPATLELTGKMRVEGEPIGTMLIAGMVTMLKVAADAPGGRGLPARGLRRWMAA